MLLNKLIICEYLMSSPNRTDTKNSSKIASENYAIGSAGIPWGEKEKSQWRALQNIKRSYAEEVESKINRLNYRFDVKQYGQLVYSEGAYALWRIANKEWQEDKPVVLITGGVHGYETSGVQGAIRFVETKLADYAEQFNFVVAPCVSPWGYETINRWNPLAIDPNRSFYQNSPAPESSALMALLAEEGHEFLAHIDLHETTDTDNSEFRPALAARDAKEQKNWNIPDGFYLVGDTTKPEAKFQRHIIESVEQVTHVAPADVDNKLIGVDLEQWGVINYAARELGLCMGVSDAPFVTTTEVYPDSPKVDDENCILAQVAVITGALEYLKSKL